MMFSSRQSSVSEQDFCKLCLGEMLWDQESGEKVCTKCGFVSPDSNDLIAQINMARSAVGSSPAYRHYESMAEGVGVSTLIGQRDVDANGKRISQSRDLKQLRRMNTIVSWDSKKRRLGKVSSEVQRITQALGLSPVVADRAFKIYLKEFNAKSVRTR